MLACSETPARCENNRLTRAAADYIRMKRMAGAEDPSLVRVLEVELTFVARIVERCGTDEDCILLNIRVAQENAQYMANLPPVDARPRSAINDAAILAAISDAETSARQARIAVAASVRPQRPPTE